MALPKITQEINTIKSTYLPKSCGTMTGNLAVSNMYCNKMSSSTTWGVGTTWNDAPSISLYGPNETSSGIPNCFSIRAGANKYALTGKPDGNLYWGGNNVITSAGGTINGTLSIGGNLGVTGEINSTNGNIVATKGIVKGARLSANNSVNDNIDFVFRHISDGGAYLPGSYARAGEWQAIPTIRGSWYSGINGYQIWNDGLIEQWGFAYATHGGRFSFHTPFTSGNYCIYFQLENVDAHYIISAYDRQTTSCYTLVYWTTNYGTGSVPAYWYARGF